MNIYILKIFWNPDSTATLNLNNSQPYKTHTKTKSTVTCIYCINWPKKSILKNNLHFKPFKRNPWDIFIRRYPWKQQTLADFIQKSRHIWSREPIGVFDFMKRHNYQQVDYINVPPEWFESIFLLFRIVLSILWCHPPIGSCGAA